MKRILCAVALIVCSMLLLACGDNKGNVPESDTQKQDWHNTIEYEGSFFVNINKKLLYSMDKGKIVLWDDDGDGSVLQEIKYDTAADDAMERLEKLDANCDGNTDLRMIYSEDDSGSSYNLWLWNTRKEKFDLCTRYVNIKNPLHKNDGTVTEVIDNGLLGAVVKVYGFDTTGSLVENSSEITDEKSVAGIVANSLAMGDAAYAKTTVTVNNTRCNVYFTGQGQDTGYLVCNSNGEWFADIYAAGMMYRRVEATDDGTLTLGDYADNAGTAYSIAEAVSNGGDVVLVARQSGVIGSEKAQRYAAEENNSALGYVIKADKQWYFSKNGTDCAEVNINNMSVGESYSAVFTSTADSDD